MDNNAISNHSQDLENSLARIKSAYNLFVEEVESAKKEHKEKISEILQHIEERKIKEIQEKIKSL